MTTVDLSALDARSERAWRRLTVAIQLELNRFVAAEVERRLRARPNFFGRMQPMPIASLRDRVDNDAIKAAGALEQPVADLRVYYGAETRTTDEEDRGFVKTVAEHAQALAERLLGEMAFPGDDKPDPAESPGMDLDATYTLDYQPSPSLVWAWRQVRECDTVRNQLADGAAPSFETRWHFPELPPVTT